MFRIISQPSLPKEMMVKTTWESQQLWIITEKEKYKLNKPTHPDSYVESNLRFLKIRDWNWVKLDFLVDELISFSRKDRATKVQ